MGHDSFAEALRLHKDAVFGFALSMLGDRDEAEDVTQDTFVALWAERGRVPVGAHRKWLLRVCRNRAVDQLRRRKVRTGRSTATRAGSEQAWGLTTGRGPVDDPVDRLADEGRSVQAMERRLEAEDVLKLVATLGEPQRSAVVLRDVQGFTYEEIADVLEISLSLVKVSLHRARKKVRALMDEQERRDHDPSR
jgi:RNA polymerase sigma-70 factor (ECF subfamily)